MKAANTVFPYSHIPYRIGGILERHSIWSHEGGR